MHVYVYFYHFQLFLLFSSSPSPCTNPDISYSTTKATAVCCLYLHASAVALSSHMSHRERARSHARCHSIKLASLARLQPLHRTRLARNRPRFSSVTLAPRVTRPASRLPRPRHNSLALAEALALYPGLSQLRRSTYGVHVLFLLF